MFSPRGETTLRNCQKKPHLTAILQSIKVYRATHIYTRDPKTCTILIPALSSNWGPSGFSCNQDNSGSSGAYVTCMHCPLSVKTDTRKTSHGLRGSWTHLLSNFSCVCMVNKNLKTPKLSSMADDAITQGGIGLGFLVHICGLSTSKWGSLREIIKHIYF